MIRNDSRLMTIAALNCALFLGFNLWRALFNNFAVEEMNANALDVGIIQGIREIPGLLAILAVVAVMWIAEIRLVSIMVVIFGVGLIWTAYVDSMTSFVLATLLMSVGFHYFMTSGRSVILKVASKADAPKILGTIGSLRSAVAVLVLALIFLTTKGPLREGEIFSYRDLFLWIGIIVTVAGFVSMFRHRGTRKPDVKHPMKFRRRYSLYYLLTFLAGSRRQIFTTFAIFLLVWKHDTSAQTAALLIFANHVITTYTNRLVGKLIAKYGERLLLTIEYVAMVAIFAAYGFVEHTLTLYVLFVLDGIFFGIGIGISTFFQKIAAQEDITANVSIGMSANHISAVAIPLIGGLLWSLGHEITFLMGSVIAFASLISVQFIPASIAKWGS